MELNALRNDLRRQNLRANHSANDGEDAETPAAEGGSNPQTRMGNNSDNEGEDGSGSNPGTRKRYLPPCRRKSVYKSRRDQPPPDYDGDEDFVL